VVERFWPFTSSTTVSVGISTSPNFAPSGLSYPVEQRQTSFVLVSRVCVHYVPFHRHGSDPVVRHLITLPAKNAQMASNVDRMTVEMKTVTITTMVA